MCREAAGTFHAMKLRLRFSIGTRVLSQATVCPSLAQQLVEDGLYLRFLRTVNKRTMLLALLVRQSQKDRLEVTCRSAPGAPPSASLSSLCRAHSRERQASWERSSLASSLKSRKHQSQLNERLNSFGRASASVQELKSSALGGNSCCASSAHPNVPCRHLNLHGVLGQLVGFLLSPCRPMHFEAMALRSFSFV